jgi:hypothetical protein
MLPAVRRHAARTLLSLALLAQAPAWAGGPFQPPDGVGNPGGADFTGYQVVGYVYGVRYSVFSALTTVFSCVNTGGADAGHVVVQFYEATGSPNRPPIALYSSLDLPIGDMRFLHTNGTQGAPFDRMIGRVLAFYTVRKRNNPAIVCDVHVENTGTGASLAHLTFHPVGAKKKKKK